MSADTVLAVYYFRSMRRERVFRDRRNPLDSLSDAELYAAYRFNRQELLSLCDDLADGLSLANRRGVLPPVMQVFYILVFSVFVSKLLYTVAAQ